MAGKARDPGMQHAIDVARLMLPCQKMAGRAQPGAGLAFWLLLQGQRVLPQGQW
jgi:hypothetical protein